jgi:hypothetical protein
MQTVPQLSISTYFHVEINIKLTPPGRKSQIGREKKNTTLCQYHHFAEQKTQCSEWREK